MPDSAIAIQDNLKYSVRELAPGSGLWGGLTGDGFGFLRGGDALLPAWGTYACDLQLRAFHYYLHNQLWSGAHDIWQQKALSTPYEFSGGRNQTYTWGDIFFESEFGQGYDELMAPFITDYLTLNRGGFLELVSLGDPDEPLKEGARILGINHLDALRIVFTGNLEYPYIYYSEYTGTPHRLHRSRVIRLSHSPTPDTRMFGMGRSPLYAALSTANTQILLGRHQNEMLNDLPPPGLIVFTNIKSEDVDNAMMMFEAERRRDGQSVYRAPMKLEGKDPAQPVTVTFTPLSQVPEGFDRQKYMDVDVNLIALNLQLDPQDIWPLSGQALGSGMQSKELAAKTEVKGPGYFLTRMERKWNTITPRQLEFKYKAQNSQQDMTAANIAGVWMNSVIVPAVKEGVLTLDEARLLAANNVSTYADVLFDEDGNIIRIPDDDPKDIAAQSIADLLAAQGTPAIPAQPTHVTEAIVPGQSVGTPAADSTANDTQQIGKDYEDTKPAFENDVAVILSDAQTGTINKSSFSARMRSTINQYGKAAYLDGMQTGGVDADAFDDTDSEAFAGILASQSTYVSGLANKIYKSETEVNFNPDNKSYLWGQKTLNDFYYAGVMSADKNGMYTFTGDDGKESCDTCKSMKGVSHRMSWYVKNKMRPGVDTESFDCGGWQCQHFLEKKSA